MIQYKLVIGSKVIGIGILEIIEKKAYFFEGNADIKARLIAVLSHPEIISITSQGIKIWGFEPAGIDKKGIEKYRYKEWYCSFVDNN